MTIILYNPNSRGGNFDYALKLFEAYRKNPFVKECHIVLPANAAVTDTADVHKILISDQPPFTHRWYSRLFFLWRSFLNPLKFYFYLRNRNGFVIFNDFDQVSSHVWIPLFRSLKRKFVFAVFLHDPDRDLYFRRKELSQLTMDKIMSVMDVAFYHEILPDKPYYKSNPHTRYVSVPHGLYDYKVTATPDIELMKVLENFKADGSKLVGALGNIRHEKNYPLIIQTLKKVKGVKLLIAGKAASSAVNMRDLEVTIQNADLSDRVLMIQKYLNEKELITIANACDGFILYYSGTFKSQSGMLNLLVPFKKSLLVSLNDSPLSKLVQQYNLGLTAKADSENELLTMLQAFADNAAITTDWDGYFAYASWENHVNIAIQALKKVNE